MAPKTWQERLQDEIWHLDLNMLRHEVWLTEKDHDEPDYGIMRSQLVHMNDYMNDLLARCKCYGIEAKRPRFEKTSEKQTSNDDPDVEMFLKIFRMTL